MFDVISYDANGNEDKVMANKLKQGFAKVYDNTCKECLGTGKRKITFDPPKNIDEVLYAVANEMVRESERIREKAQRIEDSTANVSDLFDADYDPT